MGGSEVGYRDVMLGALVGTRGAYASVRASDFFKEPLQIGLNMIFRDTLGICSIWITSLVTQDSRTLRLRAAFILTLKRGKWLSTLACLARNHTKVNCVIPCFMRSLFECIASISCTNSTMPGYTRPSRGLCLDNRLLSALKIDGILICIYDAVFACFLMFLAIFFSCFFFFDFD